MAAQYAYVMKDMTKSFPGAQKPVLSHINLQFYHGAKIGIVGPNGAGKSTLMKIMAGIDTDFQGEAWPGENVTVGYLAQEPQVDPAKSVRDNVMVQTASAGEGAVTGLVQDIDDDGYFTEKNNRWVGNTYHLPNRSGAYFDWSNELVSQAAWERFGQDPGA